MKIDPYKHEENYLRWKDEVKEKIPHLNEFNSQLLLNYLYDMENGLNVGSGSKKGARSYIRLNTLRVRLNFLFKQFEELFKINKITDICEEQLIGFFSDMKNGNIKRVNGRSYISVDTYAKVFKAFWHWHQKINKKKGIEIPDITLDLDTKQEKPDWVYLTEQEIKILCEKAKYDYRVLITFLFDTGIRAPTELMNIKVSDLFNNYKELNIREEASKTFGRRIKLMICSELIKEFVKNKGLNSDDYLFKICPSVANQYLKNLSKNIFGEKTSPAGQKYSELTMYDFRHISCCYWLPRYKSESALKYRFGWKKSDKIHYYSELLGMKDNISDDDMLIDVTKTEIEKRLLESEKQNQILMEKFDTIQQQLNEGALLIADLQRKMKELQEAKQNQ